MYIDNGFESGKYLSQWNGYDPSILGNISYSQHIGIGEDKYFDCVGEITGMSDVSFWVKFELDKLSNEDIEELILICRYKTYIENIINKELLVKLSSIFNCSESDIRKLKHSGIINLCNNLSDVYNKIYWIHNDFGNDKRIKLRDESNPYKLLSFNEYKNKNKINKIEDISENDWIYFYAYIMNVTNDTVSLTDDECKQMFLELPEDLRNSAFKYSLRDHHWSDELKRWYKENKMDR